MYIYSRLTYKTQFHNFICQILILKEPLLKPTTLYRLQNDNVIIPQRREIHKRNSACLFSSFQTPLSHFHQHNTCIRKSH